MKQEQEAHELCSKIFQKQFQLIELEIAREESLIYCPNIEEKIRETKNWIKTNIEKIRNSEEWLQEIADEYGI